MVNVDPVVVKFSVDSSDVLTKVTEMSSVVTNTMFSFQMASGYIKQFAAQLDEMGAKADNILDLADAFDITTASVQQLQNAFILSGGDSASAESAFKKLTEAMSKVKDPSSDAADAFARMGISTDGRSVSDVMADVAAQLDNVTSATDRNAIAQDLFGRNYLDTMDALKSYNTELAKKNTLSEEELRILATSKTTLNEYGVAQDYWLTRIMASGIKGAGAFAEFIDLSLKGGQVSAATQMWDDLSKKQMETADSTEEVTGATYAFTDAYKGLTDVQIDRLDLVAKIKTSQAEMIDAQISGDKEAYNNAARLHQSYINNLAELDTQAKKTAKSVQALAVTYNTTFASSLINGVVGPDVAGYSDMANWEEAKLKLAAGGDFATTGGSKATQEKAQEYLDRMRSRMAISEAPVAKATGSGGSTDIASAETTQRVETQLTKQMSAFDKYFGLVQKGLEGSSEKTAEYWTNITTNQSKALTTMMTADATFSQFVAANPTIKNIGVVMWTEEGADWNPMNDAAFMQTARMAAIISSIPTLATPKFTGIGNSAASGSNTPNVKVNVLVNVDKNGNVTQELTTSMQQAGMGGN